MIRYFRFSPQECSTMEQIRYVFPFPFNTGPTPVYSVHDITCRYICD